LKPDAGAFGPLSTMRHAVSAAAGKLASKASKAGGRCQYLHPHRLLSSFLEGPTYGILRTVLTSLHWILDARLLPDRNPPLIITGSVVVVVV